MNVLLLILQAPPRASTLQLLREAILPTWIVLSTLLLFSLVSWWLIFWKARQFRDVRKQGDNFLDQVERAHRLEDAYKAILALPDSPYGRVFRRGVNFFSELRPGSLREGAVVAEGLSLTQLEALRMVLEKEEAEERDELARGLTWLAVIGSVSPLLGLLGTVIGVMDVFLGIAATGTSSLSAVAPGVGQALVTTVAGLFVAIPSVLAYNHFVGRLNLVASELEGFSSEFVGMLAREGQGLADATPTAARRRPTRSGGHQHNQPGGRGFCPARHLHHHGPDPAGRRGSEPAQRAGAASHVERAAFHRNGPSRRHGIRGGNAAHRRRVRAGLPAARWRLARSSASTSGETRSRTTER